MVGVPLEPSDEQRRMVRAFSGFGITQEAISDHLGMDPKTLRKHFRDELDRGTVEANVKVAQSLFQMATTGKNVAAAIFWMKARAGWKERHSVEVADKDGKPVTPTVVTFCWASNAPEGDTSEADQGVLEHEGDAVAGEL